MHIIKLKNGHTLSIENDTKKLRLIVYINGVENVCRKSTKKELSSFIQSNEDQLFKGRLQLIKDEVGISIWVKGKNEGEISAADLLNYLQIAQ